MSEWTAVRLGSGLRVHHGFAFKGEYFSPEGRQIVLTPGNFVERGGFKPKSGTEKYYLGPVPERFVLRQGDVVIAMTEQAQGLLGSSATIPENNTYLHNQRIGLLEVTDPDLLDMRFVYHLMNSGDVRRQIQATATGSKVRHTAPERIQAVTAVIPSLATQKVVAGILDAIDDLIANNRRRVETLEEMARAIYREWFVKFRYSGHESVPLVDSAIGPIPEGWSATQLADIVTTQYGYTESASTEPIGPKYLRGMDINKQSWVDWSTVPYCPIDQVARSKFKVEVGDVFVIRMADPGKVGICEEDIDAVFASYLVRLRPDTRRLLPYFLFFTLLDDRYQAWVTGASTGSTRKSASAKVMTEPLIVLAPTSLQDSFDDAIRPLRETMRTLTQSNAGLATLRDQLLPKLVTGQIHVSALDLDRVLEEAVP